MVLIITSLSGAIRTIEFDVFPMAEFSPPFRYQLLAKGMDSWKNSWRVDYSCETADPAPDATNPEDNTPEDNTPEDNTPEDNTPEDNIVGIDEEAEAGGVNGAAHNYFEIHQDIVQQFLAVHN